MRQPLIALSALLIVWLFHPALVFGGYSPFGDIHWKAPVASVGALPSSGNASGDARAELTTFGVYIWNGSSWESSSQPSAITQLTGDVSAGPGPGSVPATVSSVGGSSAANIHAAELAANAATSLNTASTIAKRDGTGNFSAGTITAALSGNASTATALASDPTDCSANQVATSIAASGNLGCVSLTGSFLPNPSASTLGGIESYVAVSHQWINAISTSGVPSSTQPAFSDISSNLGLSQLPTAVTWPSSGTVQSVTPANHGVVISGSGATANITGTGSSSQALVGNGASADPTFQNVVTSVTFTGDGTVLSSTPSSAVTTTGTLTASLKTQTANTVFSGPTSGSAANPTFRALVPADYPMPVSSAQTNTYSILTTDELVLLDGTSTGFTATLPTAVGVTGKRYRIKRIDMTLANVVTLATTSSQTIDGVTTRTINTQYECWEIVSDGSNWQVVTHKSTTPWASYSPTYSAGFGTTTNNFAFWRRVGSSVEIRANFTAGTVVGSVASVSLPSGLTGIMANTGVLSGNVGFDYTSTVSGVYPVMDSSALTVIKFGSTSGRSIGNFYNGNNWGNTTNFSLTASVPVSGWSE